LDQNNLGFGYLERMLLIIGSICIVAVILVAIVSIFGDADITTLFYEKYGKDLKKVLSGKVVSIIGASTGIGSAMAIECAKVGYQPLRYWQPWP